MENHTAVQIRAKVKAIVGVELDQLETNLESLAPEERISLLLKLIPFVLPKVNDTNYEMSDNFDWG